MFVEQNRPDLLNPHSANNILSLEQGSVTRGVIPREGRSYKALAGKAEKERRSNFENL